MHSFVVVPVEGRMVPNPRVSGRIVGYESFVDESDKQFSTLTGRMENGRGWKLLKENGEVPAVEVLETNDGYFRKAIMAGDLKYVQSKDGARSFVEPELLRASVKHEKQRKAQSATDAQNAKAAADFAALDALAAAEGLTVEEFKAQSAKEGGNQ